MSSQSVLLIGASGYVGPYLSHEFLAQKSKFARIAILADPAKVSKFDKEAAAGIEIVVGSFLDPASFKGFTTVISMLGNNAMVLQPQIIDAAVSAGVTNFYPSEFGSDLSHHQTLKERYFRDKQLTRRHLEKTAKKYKDQGFGYTYIVNGGFSEFAAQPAFGFNREEKRFDFWGDTKKVEPFGGVRDVAKYTVASVLTIPEPGTILASPGRTFRIPTKAHSWEDVVAVISRIDGVDYKIVRHPNEEAYALAAKYAKEGDTDQELSWSLKALLGNAARDGMPKPWDNDKFPDIKPEDLETCLRRFLGESK